MDFLDLRELNIMTLAYLGDSVWELNLREHYIKMNLKLDNLNRKVKRFVNAKYQSKIYLEIEETIEGEASDFAKRAKNGKIKNFPKSCTVVEYRNATAFEALIAYYYLKKEQDKINSILKKCTEGDGNDKKTV